MLSTVIVFFIAIMSSCANQVTHTKSSITNQTIDTVYSEKSWYSDNYIVSDFDTHKHIDKKILIYSDTLILSWDEKEDDIIGKTYSNRKIRINSFIYDFDEKYKKIYKHEVPEDLGYISKNLIILKEDNSYTFNLILSYSACTEDCFNYEVIECKVYFKKRLLPILKIKEIISNKGIPQI